MNSNKRFVLRFVSVYVLNEIASPKEMKKECDTFYFLTNIQEMDEMGSGEDLHKYLMHIPCTL